MPKSLVSIAASNPSSLGMFSWSLDMTRLAEVMFETGLSTSFLSFTPGFAFMGTASPPFGSTPTTLAVSSNGAYHALGATGILRLYTYGITGPGIQLPTPSSVPATLQGRANFSPSGRTLAGQGILADGSVCAYAITDTGGTVRFPGPSSNVGQGRAVAFNSTGTVVAIGGQTAPFISVYDWSDDYGFGAKYPDPVSPLTTTPFNIIFGPGDRTIVIGNQGQNYRVYQWSSAGFGSAYPSSGVLGSGVGLAFTKSGRTILLGSNTAPRATALPWDDTTGFGVAYPAPLLPGSEFINGSKSDYKAHKDFDIFLCGANTQNNLLVGVVDDVGWGRVVNVPGGFNPGSQVAWIYFENNTGSAGGHVQQNRKKKRKIEDISTVSEFSEFAQEMAPQRRRIKVPKLLDTLMVRLEKSTEIAQKQRANKSAEEMMFFF